MFDLNGKKALVTGSTQGIGFEIARLLAERGATVYVHGSGDLEKCKRVAEKIGGAIPVVANLLDGAQVEALYGKTGDVDLLILNASIQYKRAWDGFSEREFDEQMGCNLKASYFLMRRYAEGMKKKGFGRIVTVGSVNQYNQHPELLIYAVSKVAQFKLVQNIAPLLAPYGITVNNVSPGAVETPRNAAICQDAELRRRVEEKIPMKRFGQPNDIAPAVLFLCSDEASYITGSDLLIDGGMSLKN